MIRVGIAITLLLFGVFVSLTISFPFSCAKLFDIKIVSFSKSKSFSVKASSSPSRIPLKNNKLKIV